jgi:repressor LexA
VKRFTPETSAPVTPLVPTSDDVVSVPLVGRIAAGVPITAEQNVDDVMALPRQLVGNGDLFMLKVVGDSMIDAAICDGDWVVVRSQATADNGDIVAAMLDDEATVKVFKQRVLAGSAGTPGSVPSFLGGNHLSRITVTSHL